jgi:hypothetical protein
MPPPDQISEDTPLRLNVAAALAYPDGSMTASGLRREAAKGRLLIERTAGKDYTTLGAITADEGPMPIRGKGARLWLRRARRDRNTGDTHNAIWIIRDGKHTEGTGCRQDDRAGAERALAEYLNRKHLEQATKGTRDPSQIPIADALALYGRSRPALSRGPRKRPAGSAG